MKKLTLLLITLFLLTALMAYADKPDQDTIKIYSGDKTIIIVSKAKKSDQSDLEYGIKTFEDKIDQYEKKIDSLEQLIDSLTEDITGINDTVPNELNSRLEDLRKQEAEYRKMIAALEKGISDIEKQLEEMNEEIETETQSEQDNQEKIITVRHSAKKFKGHWKGFEFGPNSFLTANQALINESNISSLAPELNKSFEFSFNFLEGNVRIFNFLGIVSGLGLQWNNYKYATFPTYSSDYILNLDSLYPITQPDGSVLKQISLKTIYLNVPLLLEIQFPFGSSNNFYINFGGYAGLNISSKLKYIYDLSGNKIKSKENVSKMIKPYHYGLTARIGIDQIQLYANYNLSPIFSNTQNPVLYPLSVGLRMNF